MCETIKRGPMASLKRWGEGTALFASSNVHTCMFLPMAPNVALSYPLNREVREIFLNAVIDISGNITLASGIPHISKMSLISQNFQDFLVTGRHTVGPPPQTVVDDIVVNQFPENPPQVKLKLPIVTPLLIVFQAFHFLEFFVL